MMDLLELSQALVVFGAVIFVLKSTILWYEVVVSAFVVDDIIVDSNIEAFATVVKLAAVLILPTDAVVDVPMPVGG